MNGEFRIVEVAGAPCPVFPDNSQESSVKAAFLREVTSFGDSIAEAIRQARVEQNPPVQWSGNEIFLDLFHDQAVIASQWLRDSDGTEWEIVLPLNEAERLLVGWQSALTRWNLEHPRPAG